MIIAVRFYAISREIAGTDQIKIELKEPACVGDAVDAVLTKYPKLGSLKNHLRYAIDNDFADLTQKLKNNQELCVIPPVSGG
ncbi:MAG: hypothetical protein A2161_03320 [Candidatus Schekmanbacteria bacterium RBG_13_48_7]|uniref:Molybdopterin synthase sulfur carrier subunit n=1 Tax=Candidatus Schekmanbacteria bacterium RBG_13_48_7 TaxID=1817878 RepID=A0A1F7RV57_9BACT|nr:MAG: hypothetical protein A2161_03320 [Candidatus Schekmanbacteria bacterium RBG_13_48_7]